MNFYIETN